MGAAAQPRTPGRAFQTSSKGYTPTPHPFYEHLPTKVSGLAQYVAIGYIMRRTRGAERPKGTPAPETAEITIPEFPAVTGEKSNNLRWRELMLADAAERRLIAREKSGRSYAYKAVPYPCRLEVMNADGVLEEVEFPGWEAAPDYEPRKKPSVAAVAAVAAEEAYEAEEEHEDEGAEASVDAPETSAALGGPKLVKRDEPLLLLPGQRSKPVPLSDAVRQVVYCNEGVIPLRISPLDNRETLLVPIRGYPNSTSGIEDKGRPVSGREYPNSTSGIDKKVSPRIPEVEFGYQMKVSLKTKQIHDLSSFRKSSGRGSSTFTKKPVIRLC